MRRERILHLRGGAAVRAAAGAEGRPIEPGRRSISSSTMSALLSTSSTAAPSSSPPAGRRRTRSAAAGASTSAPKNCANGSKAAIARRPKRASRRAARRLAAATCAPKSSCAASRRTKEYIAAGDIFQANLTQRWAADASRRLRSVRPLRRAAHRQSGAVRRVHRHPGPAGLLHLAGRLSAAPRRRRRNQADQGHAPALPGSQGGSPPRRGAARERKGSRREHHDRRSDAQRFFARLPAAQRRGAGALRAGELRLGASSRFGGARKAEARPRRAASHGRLLPRRLDHRRPEDPRDGDHPRARAGAARRLLRLDRAFRL